ncbi:MAG: cobalamin biosynthesis protein [Shinella sp.]|nr:cobalamin biosynthesis protein [Shinella sp.]
MTKEPENSAETARRTLVLGLGCERGTPAGELLDLASRAVASVGAQAGDIALVASLDTRAAEPAMHAVVQEFRVPFRTFDAATLEAETPRLANPSEIVFARTGCHGVAEAAALASVGLAGRLLLAKIKSAHATAAIAIAESIEGDGAGSSHIDSAGLQAGPISTGARRETA